MFQMVRTTRKISWIKAALKDFQDFPVDAQDRAGTALTMVAEGAKSGHCQTVEWPWKRRVGIGDQIARRGISSGLRAPAGR
jgi:phage-related protein